MRRIWERVRIVFLLLAIGIGVSAGGLPLTAYAKAKTKSKKGKAKKHAPSLTSNQLFFNAQAAKVGRVRNEIIKELQKIIKGTKNKKMKAQVQMKLLDNYYKQYLFVRSMENERAINKKGGGASKGNHSKSIAIMKKVVGVCIDIEKSVPKLKEIDQIYFFHGSALQELDKPDEAIQQLKKVVKKKKSDKRSTAAFLVGEYYFDKSNYAAGVKFYGVVAKDKKSSLRLSAIYKLAWSFFFMQKFNKSLDSFKKVVKLAHKGSDDKFNLRETVLKEMFVVYAEIGRPEQAKQFYTSLGVGNYYYKNLHVFAAALMRKGEIKRGITLMKEKIRRKPNAEDGPDSYRTILSEVVNLANKKNLLNEMIQFAQLFGPVSGWAKANARKPFYRELKPDIEKTYMYYLKLIHALAQKQKKNVNYLLAFAGYQAYNKFFPQGKNRYDAFFQIAEIEMRMTDRERNRKKKQALFCNATVSYAKVASMNLRGKYFSPASKSMLINSAKCFGGEWSRLRRAKYVYHGAEKPLSSHAQQFIKYCGQYMKWAPRSKPAEQCKLDIIEVYLKTHHFAEAEKRCWLLVNQDKNKALLAAQTIVNLHMRKKDEITVFRKIIAAKYIKGTKLAIKLNKYLYDTFIAKFFIKIKMLEKAKRWEEAAAQSMAFYKQFPKSKEAEGAFFNAALYLEKGKLYRKAIDLYSQFLQVFPRSQHRVPVYEKLAAFSESLLLYTRASEFYKTLYNVYADQQKKMIALQNAAISLDIVNDSNTASVYRLFLKVYGNQPTALSVAHNLLEYYERNKRYNEMIAFASGTLLKMRLDVNEYAKVLGKIATAYRKMNNLAKMNQAHQTILQNIRNPMQLQGISKEYFAEAIFERATKFIPKLHSMPIRSTSLNKDMEQKLLYLQSLEGEFSPIFTVKDAKWGFASFVVMGEVYEKTAMQLDTVPLPAAIKPEAQKTIRATIRDKVTNPLRQKAITYFMEARKLVPMQLLVTPYRSRLHIALRRIAPTRMLSIEMADVNSPKLVEGLLYGHESLEPLFP